MIRLMFPLLCILSAITSALTLDLAWSYMFTTGHGLHPVVALTAWAVTWGATWGGYRVCTSA